MLPLRFAEITDLGTAFQNLTQEERIDAEIALEEASILVRTVLANRSVPLESVPPDVLKLVVIRLCRRVLADDDYISTPIGVESTQIGVGPFQRSFKFAGGSSGQLYLGKTEYELLGLHRQQVFSIDLLPAGYRTPT